MQLCCCRARNSSFCIMVAPLNSSSSPNIKLWKSARGFKTLSGLREILQDHFMSDWNRCPLASLVQALAAHRIILYVAGWLWILIWPEWEWFHTCVEASFCLHMRSVSGTLPFDVLILQTTFFLCLGRMQLFDGSLGQGNLTGVYKLWLAWF